MVVAREIHARALRRAALIRGSEDVLREELKVTQEAFERWKDGREEMPPEVFLRIVDIIVEREVRTLQQPPDFPH